jgi:hypothetical protein
MLWALASMSYDRSGAVAAADGSIGGGTDVPFFLAVARFGFKHGISGKEAGNARWGREPCACCGTGRRLQT